MARKKLNTPLSQKKYTRTTSKIVYSITELKVFLIVLGIFGLLSIIPFALKAPIGGGVLLGIGFVLGVIMLIPLPSRRIFIHDYLFRCLKYALSPFKKINGLNECNKLFFYDGFEGNMLRTKKETILFFRISGQPANQMPEEDKQSTVVQLNSFFKSIDTTKVTITHFKTTFNLQNSIDYLKYLRDDSETLPKIFQANWLLSEYRSNFEELSTPSTTGDGNTIIPTPLDKVYLMGFHGFDYQDALNNAMKHLQYLPSLLTYYPASESDIKIFIEQTYGKANINITSDHFTIEELNKDQTYKKLSNPLIAEKIEFKPNYFVLHSPNPNPNQPPIKTYYSVFSVRHLPDIADDGWLFDLYENSQTMLIHKISPLTQKQIKKLSEKARKTYDRAASAGSSSILDGREKMSKLNEVDDMVSQIEQKDISLLRNNFYFLVKGMSKEELLKNRSKTIYALENVNSFPINRKDFEMFQFLQYEAFLNMMVSKKDNLNVVSGANLDSLVLASGMPFQQQFTITDDGFLMGFDDKNNSPVFFNPMNKKSFSGLIVGKTRSGKSFFAKLLSNWMMLIPGTKVWWFDPQNEMKALCENHNGLNIDLSSSDPTSFRINVEATVNSFATTKRVDVQLVWKAYNFLLNTLFGIDSKEPILIEETDFNGGGLHQKTLRVKNPFARPVLVYDLLKGLMKNELVYEFYKYIYDRSVVKFTINPLRILRTSDASIDDAILIFKSHLIRIQTWFETWMPNLNSNQTSFLMSSLKDLYKDFGIFIKIKGKDEVLSIPSSALDSTQMPLISDLYSKMLKQYNSLYKLKEKQKVDNEFLCDINQVLNVFDNLVPMNRYKQRGYYSDLWAEDNKIDFIDTQFINFNIEKLNNDIPAENKSVFGELRLDAKAIATAQMFLAFDVIKNMMIQNRINNQNTGQDNSGFVFLDEFHKMTGDRALFAQVLDIIKTGAKYKYGVWPITQDLKDLNKLDKNSSAAEVLTSNLQYKFIFQTEGYSLNSVKRFFDTAQTPLTRAELSWIKSVDNVQGRCIMVSSNAKRTMFNVLTSRPNVGSFLETIWDFENLINYPTNKKTSTAQLLNLSNLQYNKKMAQKFAPFSSEAKMIIPEEEYSTLTPKTIVDDIEIAKEQEVAKQLEQIEKSDRIFELSEKMKNQIKERNSQQFNEQEEENFDIEPENEKK